MKTLLIALTSEAPFSGTSSFARYIAEKTGSSYFSMSHALIMDYCNTTGISYTGIQDNKEMYRDALRKYAEIHPMAVFCGLNFHAPQQIIEKVRTHAQASLLHSMGYTIYSIYRPIEERYSTARERGLSDANYSILCDTERLHYTVAPCQIKHTFHNGSTIDDLFNSLQVYRDVKLQ